jgi:hypothetical protein
MFKFKTRVLGAVMATAMIAAVAAAVPANAAKGNTQDRGWNFGISNTYAYSTPQDKLDDSYCYVLVQRNERMTIMHTQIMGRGVAWTNQTIAGSVDLKRNVQYSVRNTVNESLLGQAALRGSAGPNEILIASGVWSPDSVGVYTIV